MHIVNKHGVTHSVANRPLVFGERLATDAEVAAYEAVTPKAEKPAGLQNLESTAAIAERDAEIARLQALVDTKAKK